MKHAGTSERFASDSPLDGRWSTKQPGRLGLHDPHPALPRALSRHRAVSFFAVAAAAATVGIFVPAPAFADETRDQQWYLDALQIDKVHELSQGEGVTIGVIDSGIDADHPDLKGNVEAGKSYGTSKGDGLKDTTGHGTSVASLIVGHGHGTNNADGILGIAPKAKVISVSVDATVEANYDIADAIKWLVDQKVDIISISMSASPTDFDAIGYADKHGVAVVASAGNVEPDPYLGETANMGWPAYDSGTVPVSGTDQNGTFWDGSVDLKSASPQPKNGVSAPATDLLTAKNGGGYETHDGTSGSAPLVAGTIALVKSAFPNLKYAHVMDRALLTGDDKGKEGYDDKYGWGIINPYRALTEDVKHEKGGPSTKSDRVPLSEQGKESSKSGKESGDIQSDDSALMGSTNTMLGLSIGIGAAVLLIAAAATIIIVKRRKKHVSANATSRVPNLSGPPDPPSAGTSGYQRPPIGPTDV